MRENKESIISHGSVSESLEQVVEKAQERIRQRQDMPYVTVERQLEILDELTKFPLGRFLLQNQGLNGYWTDYVVFYRDKAKITGKDKAGRALTEFEKIILDKLFGPTQERGAFFKQLTQAYVREGALMASIPCGLMRDLLGLDFSACRDFRLVGIDLDQCAIDGARKLAEEYNLSDKVEFHLCDAWKLPFKNRFSLLTSNGLATYEPDHKKIAALYIQFSQALIQGGVLVTSFAQPQSEWDMDYVDQNYLTLRKIIFSDLINVKWGASYQTQEETEAQLKEAGFSKIDFFPVKSRMFVRVLATKGGQDGPYL